MSPTLFYLVVAPAMALRLAAQWRARGPAPEAPPRGRASVVLWFLTYLALLAGALFEIHRSGEADRVGVVLLVSSLALRFAGLHALRGHYHEAIALQSGHRVVRSGVYRFLRHPLHLALLAEAGALALLSGRLWTLPCWLVMLVVLLHRNHQEEAVLCESLGPPYRDYLAGGAWDLIDLLPFRRAPGRAG